MDDENLTEETNPTSTENDQAYEGGVSVTGSRDGLEIAVERERVLDSLRMDVAAQDATIDVVDVPGAQSGTKGLDLKVGLGVGLGATALVAVIAAIVLLRR